MNGNWEWLIGKRLSLGTVIDVFEDTATIKRGEGETNILICELLYEDYRSRDRYDASLSEAFNSGDGVYHP